MERITGSEALGLFEAYNAVYAPQELTEEQVWEEVETWVNSLIEEGYDLSEYTWEDMYEEYLNELQQLNPQQLRSLGTAATKSGLEGTFTAGGGRAALMKPGATFQSVFAQGSKNLRTQQKPSPAPVTRTPATTTQRPAIPAARPATTATTRPPAKPVTAAPKVSPAPNPSLAAASSALSGTGALAAKPKPQSDIGAMITRSQQRQAAQTPKPAAAPAPARPMGGGRERMLRQSFDVFDVIKGHLLDEGYADTEEAAEAIMVNMGEEWRESIVEGGFNSSGRYDVGGGRTVGPVAGAVRSLFSGNLPKGQTYVPPSSQKGTNRPPAVPASRGDSGKLTDFGAGGGKAKLKTGMSVGQVQRQGRMNKGDYSG